LQAANAATPEDAGKGFVVHVRAAPAVPVPLVIASCIEAELLVTVFPPASSTVTTGCVDHAVPPVPPPGCVVKTNCAPVPTVIVVAVLTALVSPLLVAVSV
jgi:hypothetical protein